MALTLRQHVTGDPELPAILALIRSAFAEMDGIIDPPSSMHRLTDQTLQETAAQSEVWSLGPPPSACVVLTPKPQALYIGKLSVAKSARGHGLARKLVEHAALRAAALSLPALELEVRIELTRNHAAFKAMGFHETGRTAHAGYSRPTSITYQRLLCECGNRAGQHFNTRT